MSALAEPPWCVCSACLGTPEVFTLGVMQLVALLGFPCWLTEVDCSTPAVMVSLWGWGFVLSQLYCSPIVFFFVPAQLPLPLLPLRGSAPLQGGLACLSPVCWSTLWCGWRGLAATFSSVPVRCFPCCRYIVFFWASPAPLACWVGCCFAPCVRAFQLR